MSELKLSERIRVGLAVNGEIVIGRGTAVPLIKALEAMERDADRCNKALADFAAMRDRRDALNERIIRDILVVAFALTCIGWTLAGVIR
ncbi:hypothetical protein [Paracoccus aminovorans]|uniref:hypothetical protein n=1 Tax=Paracoccus aminovorans TaxID=34004 RepID=UPI000780F7D9|nr:hypothetical protein [Paracoccus aminovorans]